MISSHYRAVTPVNAAHTIALLTESVARARFAKRLKDICAQQDALDLIFMRAMERLKRRGVR